MTAQPTPEQRAEWEARVDFLTLPSVAADVERYEQLRGALIDSIIDGALKGAETEWGTTLGGDTFYRAETEAGARWTASANGGNLACRIVLPWREVQP